MALSKHYRDRTVYLQYRNVTVPQHSQRHLTPRAIDFPPRAAGVSPLLVCCFCLFQSQHSDHTLHT